MTNTPTDTLVLNQGATGVRRIRWATSRTMWLMRRVRLMQWIAGVILAGMVGADMENPVHAQATVETGGATAGAANNVKTLAPDFSGMASTITSTAGPTPEAVTSQPEQIDQLNAPDSQSDPDEPASEAPADSQDP